MRSRGRAEDPLAGEETRLDVLLNLTWRRFARIRTVGWMLACFSILLTGVVLRHLSEPFARVASLGWPTLDPLFFPQNPDCWHAMGLPVTPGLLPPALGLAGGALLVAVPLLVMARLVVPAFAASIATGNHWGRQIEDLVLAGVRPVHVLIARAAAAFAPFILLAFAVLVVTPLFGLAALDRFAGDEANDAVRLQVIAKIVWVGIWYPPLSMVLSLLITTSVATFSRRWDTAVAECFLIQLVVVPAMHWGLVLVCSHLMCGSTREPSVWIHWLPYLPLAALALEAILCAVLVCPAYRSLRYPKERLP